MASTVSRQLGGTQSGARGTVHGRNVGSAPYALESNRVKGQNGAVGYDQFLVLRYDRALDQQSGAVGSVTLGQIGPFNRDVVLMCGGSNGFVVTYNASCTTTVTTLSLQVKGQSISTLSQGSIMDIGGSLTTPAGGAYTLTVAQSPVYVAQGQSATVFLSKVSGGSGVLSSISKVDFYIRLVPIGDTVPLNYNLTLSTTT